MRGLSVHVKRIHSGELEEGSEFEIEAEAPGDNGDDDVSLASEIHEYIGQGNLEDFNRELGDQPTDYYLNKQIKFCKDIYGDDALYADNWESFVSSVNKNSTYKEKDLVIIQIIQCLKNDLCVTKRQGDQVLKLFHNLIDIVADALAKNDTNRMTSSSAADLQNTLHSLIPSGWRQVTDRFGSSTYPKSYTMPYPKRWFMDKWVSSSGVVPRDVTLIPLDPIEKIAMQWLDPEIAFANKNHIKFSYEPEIAAGK
jgi:hypothetical protein